MGTRKVLQTLQPCSKDRTVLVGTGMPQTRYANVHYVFGRIGKKKNAMQYCLKGVFCVDRVNRNVVNRYRVFGTFKVFVEDKLDGNSG